MINRIHNNSLVKHVNNGKQLAIELLQVYVVAIDHESSFNCNDADLEALREQGLPLITVPINIHIVQEETLGLIIVEALDGEEDGDTRYITIVIFEWVADCVGELPCAAEDAGQMHLFS